MLKNRTKKGWGFMRLNERKEKSHLESSNIFGINFHDFIEKESYSTNFELASEFGLTMRDVKKIKKHLGRS